MKCLFLLMSVLVRCLGQEKADLLAEKNEIPYNNDDNLSKSSSKPALVIEESEFKAKTSSSDIREQFFGRQDVSSTTTEASATVKQEYPTRRPLPALICPPNNVPKPFLALPCFANSNCGLLGRDMLCCGGRCLKGVEPPKHDPAHDPVFFGIIKRKCPEHPLTELSEVKECITDDDCGPRICCGENLKSGERARFCRTPIPVWDSIPLPSNVVEPFKQITSYMQCTPPPPPHLDLYPKSCQNPMDCFPNLCCQEKGLKYCRPPKRSLLALVAEVGQRIIPETAARKFIERIS